MKKIASLLVVVVVAIGIWVVFLRPGRTDSPPEPAAGAPAATGAPAASQAPAVPVVVTTVTRTPTPIVVHATGSVQPDASVAVKSRIDGVIAQVAISDSADVKAGQLLFALDDRAQQVALAQAQATLARDKANLIQAKTNYDRLAKLPQDEVVSRQQLDNALSANGAAEATLKVDEAMVAGAQLQLTYDKITAPIDGRAGFIASKVGNVVHASDTAPLVLINRVHPIQVNFAVPQAYLNNIRTLAAQGSLKVAAITPAGEVQGKLAYIDNAVDTTTGTVALRGLFDNLDDKLWPGELVDVTLTLRTQEDALVVPDQAVQQGQNGPYLWVITPASVAEVRPVKIDRSINNMSVVASGVQAGEKVALEGAFRLAPGTHVNIRQSAQNSSGATGGGATP